MSSNKEHNQKLKDLLNKTSAEEHDEFEDAAREGFAQLKDEKEALELKNSLDKKIYAEVFTNEKQESRKFSWLAAAALIGVIGFSIYFIQTYFKEKDSGLAIHETPIKPTPETASPMAAPVLEKAKDELPAATNSEQSISTETKKPVKAISSESANGVKESEMEDITEPQYTSAASAAPALSNAAPGDNEGKKRAEKNDQSADKDQYEDLAVAPVDAKSRAAQSEPEALKNKKAESRARTSESSPPSAGAAAAPEVLATNSAPVPLCTYKGGDTELKKDLREKLLKEEVLYKFDAVLSLNKKAKVEKVTFINVYGMSDVNQQKLMEVLKNLNKFQVSGLSGNQKLIEYKIEFRP